MKTINESFTEEEFADMKAGKDSIGITWHDFLFAITTHEKCLEIIREEKKEAES